MGIGRRAETKFQREEIGSGPDPFLDPGQTVHHRDFVVEQSFRRMVSVADENTIRSDGPSYLIIVRRISDEENMVWREG